VPLGSPVPSTAGGGANGRGPTVGGMFSLRAGAALRTFTAAGFAPGAGFFVSVAAFAGFAAAFAGFAATFAAFAPFFAAVAFAAVLPALRGFGAAPRPACRPEDDAACAEAFLVDFFAAAPFAPVDCFFGLPPCFLPFATLLFTFGMKPILARSAVVQSDRYFFSLSIRIP
jgi:hypothetical protein